MENVKAGGWTWGHYGNVAAEIYAPDGHPIGIIGATKEKRLHFVEEDDLYRKGVPEEMLAAEANRLRESVHTAAAYAQHIVDALNAYEGGRSNENDNG